MIRVKLKNINKRYHAKEVLQNVFFEFHNGLYLLCGENGTGKSTLIKIIKGFTFPTYGEVEVKGKICYTPDKMALPNFLTVDEVLRLLKEYYRSEVEINSLYDVYNYGEYKNYKLKNTSKGTYQKLILSIFLLNKSDIYLFDEPLNGLDVDTCNIFIGLLRKLLDDNKLVIISSHLPDFYLELNPIILRIENGKIE